VKPSCSWLTSSPTANSTRRSYTNADIGKIGTPIRASGRN
jgi:hypothetical protein